MLGSTLPPVRGNLEPNVQLRADPQGGLPTGPGIEDAGPFRAGQGRVVDELVYRAERVRSGESVPALARGAASGELTRVRRGAYIATDRWRSIDAAERHLLRMRAVAAASRGETVFSHHSAALIWGIPLTCGIPDLPHIVVDAECSITRRAGAVRHARRKVEVERSGGFAVTSLRQTVLDLVAGLAVPHGIPVLDFALSERSPRRLVHDELAAWLQRSRPFRGARRLEAALAVATGEGESPLESLSLFRFAQAGIPRPLQQHEFSTPSGTFFVDFYWPGPRVVGEADGRAKYETSADLWNEKRREDAIRALVSGFVRWSWSDVWNPSAVPDRLRRTGV